MGGTLPGGTAPVVDVPALPVGGGTDPSTGPVPSTPVAPARPAAGPAHSGQEAASAGPSSAGDRSVTGAPAARTSVASTTGPVAAVDGVQDATLVERASLVPADRDGHRTPFPAQHTGALGGGSSTTGGVAAVGIVGSTDGTTSLAAGSRGTLSDDAVPASVVGEHDVAPD